ncbi:MAG: hypothetical protein ABT25_22210 [Variovorax sp. SCN 67-20]|nr:MAG: hypothetical protein ABT25_22210 [Variovorax sp. SCN 67-20]
MSTMTTEATLFTKLGRIWRHRWIDEAEVRRALPDEAPIPLLRHAENLVDAAEQALHGTHA